MIDHLINLDTELFIFLNSIRCGLCDFLMWWASSRLIWIPLYLVLLYMMWKKYKSSFWILLLTIALMVLTTDQLGNLFKNGFARLRPTHNPDLEGIVNYLNGYKGGLYSFFSGHSANAFGVAIFTIMMKLNVKRRALFNTSLIAWAILVAYSRIYLGVHYPGDIIVGAIIGSLIALLYSQIYLKLILGRLQSKQNAK